MQPPVLIYSAPTVSPAHVPHRVANTQVCRTPELACRVSLQPLERFETLDAVIIFSDILVIPQAMGMEVQMVKGKGPVFPDPLVTPADVAKLNLTPDVEETLGYVFDALNLTRERIAGRVPLIGFCGGPWTLMAYMVEGAGTRTFAKCKGWLYNHPAESHALLAAMSEILVQYLVGQYRAGAQLVQVFESWAGELPRHLFDEFVFPYVALIARKVKAQCPDLPMTIFGRNIEHAFERFAKETLFDVVGLDWQSDPAVVRSLMTAAAPAGRSVALQGNLDPCALYGSEDVIRSEVQRMLDAFGAGTPGYIANLGHGLQPTHDPERVGAFVLAVQELSAAQAQS